MAKAVHASDEKITKKLTSSSHNYLIPKIVNLELPKSTVVPLCRKCLKPKPDTKPTKTSISDAAKKSIKSLKECAEESRKLFTKYQKDIERANTRTNLLYGPATTISLSSYRVDTNDDVFSARLDSTQIRERYKLEIDNLRKRLMEMRNLKRPSLLKMTQTKPQKDKPKPKPVEKTASKTTSPLKLKDKSFFGFEEFKKLSKNISEKESKEETKPKIKVLKKASVSKPKITLQTDNIKSIFECRSKESLKNKKGSLKSKSMIVECLNQKKDYHPKTKQLLKSSMMSIGKIKIEEDEKFEDSISTLSVKEEDNKSLNIDKTESKKIDSPKSSQDSIKASINTIDSYRFKALESIEEREEKEESHILPTPTKSKTIFASGDSFILKWPIRESLFPHVPPYWRFCCYHATQPVKIPFKTRRMLKWKLTNITPNVVRKILHLSGFQLCRTTSEWVGTWGKHMKATAYKELTEMQKLNHFPGTYQIGRKDRLWKNLQDMAKKHGEIHFNFMPYTYLVPEELLDLEKDWLRKIDSGGDGKWIIKPPASARGIGIKVINKFEEVPKKQARIVQLYISKPYLINGNKFDIRLYALVTSFCPLKIFLWPEGLARFASCEYNDSESELENKFIHLTNYSINKTSSQYASNDDAKACQGHKWTLSALWDYLKGYGVDTMDLWNKLKDMVIKAIISCEGFITPLCEMNTNNRYNCYELFGIDILLDCNLKPWLIEFNISPSLHGATALDVHVKAPLVKAVFDLAKFHLPPGSTTWKSDPQVYEARIYSRSLTNQEKSKHFYYESVKNRKDYIGYILNDITPDDLKQLIEAEDELEAKGQFQRIFPTETTHTYLNFMETRYYNRLFDAWEQRYSNQRIQGISYLQRLCADKLHLRTFERKSLTALDVQENTKPGEDSSLKDRAMSTFMLKKASIFDI